MVLLVGSIGAFFWQRQETKALQTEVIRLQAEVQQAEEKRASEAKSVARLKSQINGLMATLKHVEQRARPLAATTPASSPAPTESTAAPSAEDAANNPPDPTPDFMKQMSKMLSDPSMKEMMRNQKAMGVQLTYAGLAKALNLNPTEARQVMDLLTERQLSTTADNTDFFANGKPDMAAISAASKADAETRKSFDDKLSQILGPDRYRAFKDYEGSIPERSTLNTFERQLSANGLALQENQSRGLMNIMKEERARKKPTPPPTTTELTPTSGEDMLAQFEQDQVEYNQRVRDRSRALLSPEQLAILEKTQKQSEAFMEMGRKMSRQFVQPQK